MRTTATVAVALLLGLVVPGPSGAIYINTTTVTGDYIDLATSVVYHYNAPTGTLSTTGQIGDPLVFQTLTLSACAADTVCYTTDNFVTGQYCYQVHVLAKHDSGGEDSTWSATACGAVTRVVTHALIEDNPSWVGLNGLATITLYRGSVVVLTDSMRY